MKKVRTKIKGIGLKIIQFIKKRKLILIIAFCALLFVMGLVRDIKKNKKIDNKNTESSELLPKNTRITIRITGGVKEDYYGYINHEMVLFEIILNYCKGFTDFAIIDEVPLTEKISQDYELIIKENDIKKNNEIIIYNYQTKSDSIYRYNGRVNEDTPITIYQVNSDISEEDYQILTKGEEQNISSLLNINKATVEELVAIGLSKSKAEKVVEYRKTNGNFESVEDITKVSGIGEATLEKIRDKICTK